MKTSTSLIAERLATLPMTKAERARPLELVAQGEAIGNLFFVLADLFLRGKR